MSSPSFLSFLSPPLFSPFHHYFFASFVTHLKTTCFLYARTDLRHCQWDCALRAFKKVLEMAHSRQTNRCIPHLWQHRQKGLWLESSHCFFPFYLWLLWVTQNGFWRLKFPLGMPRAHQRCRKLMFSVILISVNYISSHNFDLILWVKKGVKKCMFQYFHEWDNNS